MEDTIKDIPTPTDSGTVGTQEAKSGEILPPKPDMPLSGKLSMANTYSGLLSDNPRSLANPSVAAITSTLIQNYERTEERLEETQTELSNLKTENAVLLKQTTFLKESSILSNVLNSLGSGTASYGLSLLSTADKSAYLFIGIGVCIALVGIVNLWRAKKC